MTPLSQNVLLDDLIEDTEYLGTLQGEDLEEDRITFLLQLSQIMEHLGLLKD